MVVKKKTIDSLNDIVCCNCLLSVTVLEDKENVTSYCFLDYQSTKPPRTVSSYGFFQNGVWLANVSDNFAPYYIASGFQSSIELVLNKEEEC